MEFGGLVKPQNREKTKPLDEISQGQSNTNKRRKIVVQYDGHKDDSKTDSSSRASCISSKISQRMQDFSSDDDDQAFLLISSFQEEDKVSTTAVVDPEESQNEEFCGCSTPSQNPNYKIVDRFNRYTIGKLSSDMDSTGKAGQSVVYHVKNEKTQKWIKMILRDSWARTPYLNEGMVVNVVGSEPDENEILILERDQGYLIVEPDRLVSVTSVVSQCWCDRKVAFSERIRFPLDNMDTLKGIIAHELIGKAMMNKIKEGNELKEELLNFLKSPDILEKAYGLDLSQQQLEDVGLPLLEYVLAFNKQRVLSKGPDQKWKINSVKDIEDCFWNPEFGIKGKVDCTVEIRNQFNDLQVIPLEFKTGNPRFIGKSNVRAEHKGQVQLYTLLMRSFLEPSEHNQNGMLLYIMEKFFLECTASIRDTQSLIMARNQVLFNTPINGKDGAFASLPRPTGVDFDRNCSRCEHKNICSVSLKTKLQNEGIEKDSKSITEKKLEDSLCHLSKEEIKFFEKWLRIINLEADEDELTFDAKNLWLKSVKQREKDGKCLGELIFLHQNEDKVSSVALISFCIPESKQQDVMNIFEKDFIILGTSHEPCVSYGSVEMIKDGVITVSMERLMGSRHTKLGTLFTIDKIISNSAGMMQFVYLAKLMEDSPIASRIRSYIIGKKKPVFGNMSKKDITKEHEKILSKYNKYQRIAIIKSLSTDSFLMVKGSPGCGKTTTIVGLMRLLVLQKKTVLIAAYTSNAVDNILLKFAKHDTNFIRIGSGKLKDDVLAERSTSFLRNTAKTVEDLTKIYNDVPVVATTLMSLKHPIFKIRKFDYCIVDEGSQALPTAVFGVLMHATKYIVFGDPNQLPATIKSREVKSMGIEDNLFAMYPEPEFSCSLTIQYRMSQYIMKLANELLYGNEMKCGSDDQATEYLSLPPEQVKQYLMKEVLHNNVRKWLCLAASRKAERSVLYFNTESISAFDKVVSSTVQNEKEKDITMAIVQMLVKCGLSEEDIGLIAPYRGQVHLLRESLRNLELDIEVNTVDQYQGREKNLVIVSLTKSLRNPNESGKNEEGILNDVRRLNVAITRAKMKVILIGNSKTLKTYPACKRLLELLGDQQIYKFSNEDFPDTFFKTENTKNS